MRTRSQEMRARAMTSVAIVLAILIVVSLLSLGRFVRADLTAKKEFTISDSSRTTLRELDDIVNVTVYMSNNLPQHLTGFRTRVEDILDEYRAFGGDRLRISFVDPTTDPETERKVQMLGIPPVQLQALERDRAEIVNAYLGMSVMFEDKQEIIPVLLSEARLEYELTSAILKVMSRETPTVGFLAGHEERSIDAGYRTVAEELRDNYNVQEVILGEGEFVPKRISTLVIAGPRELEKSELYALDQFIMRGGRALFAVDGVEIATGGLSGQPAETNVGDFLEAYGARVNKDLVVDRVNSNASFQTGFMTLSMPYPYWPKVVEANLSKDNPVVSELDAVVFPWASSIELSEEPVQERETAAIATSSGYSWTVPAFSDLNPRQQFIPPGDMSAGVLAGEAPGKVLAAALTGRFESAYAGQPVPVQDEASPIAQGPRLDVSVPTQILVFGNSRMFDDMFLRQFPGNFVVFLNAVDWLTLGDKLIGIRSKSVQDRPLKEVSDTQRATIKFLATFGVPALVVGFGLIRAAVRRRKKILLADYLGG